VADAEAALVETRPSLLRERKADEHHRVTYVELFFDLVFVFAITQISHFLLAHSTPMGVLQTAILMLAVWWVWVFTSWITNWLDPEQTPVRLMLFVLMGLGLLLSTSIPKAFDSRGLAFALAFTAMQVGRTAFFALVVPKASEGRLKISFVRILVWLCVSGAFWILGGLYDGQLQLWFWLIALGIEYLGPVSRFWVPLLGASATSDWSVEGGHMAERCALFIIIALGESIVVTGATFSEIPWTATAMTAFGVALWGSIAMWWIYFHIGVHVGSERISHSSDPGRLARLAYTYLHLPIVAGIVVSAVADELLLAHPTGHADLQAVLSMVGGPLLFLIGVLLFKHSIRSRFQPSHLAGIGALLLLAPLGHLLSPLQLSAAAAAILFAVGVWEAVSFGATASSPVV
jgi:low temperature requirement protein LtrA